MADNSHKKRVTNLSLSIKIFYILISLLFVLEGAYALKKTTPLQKYIHDIWTTRNGLPQDTVQAILQDKLGYIWVGTDKGISRFNGNYFITFNSSNTEGIRHDRISSLLIGSDGNMWVGSHGGGVSLYRNNQFTNYSTENGLSCDVILCIIEDANQVIWLGTLGGGLICYKDNKFFAYNKSHGLSSNVVQALLCDRRGYLWIGCDNGLNRFRNGAFKIFSTEHGLRDNNIRSILEDSKGDLWVGTDNGVTKIKKKNLVKWNSKQIVNLTTKNGLNDNCVHSILQDKDGIIWVGTSMGLNRILRNKIEYFKHRAGLSNLQTLSVFQDRWGNLWVGTRGGGLSILKNRSFVLYTQQDGLSREMVTAVCEDQDSVLWVGTQGGGLNRLKENRFKIYTKNDGLWSDTITSLCCDSMGNVWIGTRQGLNRIKDGIITKIGKEKGFTRTSIDVVFMDSKKNLWIGTRGNGLILYKNASSIVLNQAHGLTSNFISAVSEDCSNNIWVGSQGGLVKLTPLKELGVTGVVGKAPDISEFFQLNTFTKRNGFKARHITDIYPDKNGVLWLGTIDSGLIRLKNNQITLFGAENSMLDSIIYRIMEDNKSRLWLSTNQGVFSVSKRVLDNFADKKRDHLYDYHFKENTIFKSLGYAGGFQPSGWQDHNGKLWFPTLKGLALIDPQRKWFKIKEDPVSRITNKNEFSPAGAFQKVIVERPVVIESVKINGSLVDRKIKKEFPPGTTRIELYFSAINYSISKQILYSCSLKGYDEKRSILRGTGRMVYENLGPGTYTFEVTAQNSDGSWSHMGDSYSFTIKAGFFQTLWFPLLMAIFIVGGIKLIMLWYQIRKGNKEVHTKKYVSSKLTPGRSRAFLKKILVMMEDEEPYLDHQLSLHKLSQKLGESKETISRVINEQRGQNFNDFVNHYRINRAKRFLTDPNTNKYKLLKIAYDSGFNSLSVFNSAFKKHTSMSPSKYRATCSPKNIDNE